MTLSKHSKLLSLFAVSLLMTACSGGNKNAQINTSAQQGTSLNRETAAIDRAMEKAMAQAEASGNQQEVLAMLAQVHARAPEDAVVATRYGRALREDDQINAAIRTLKPFSTGANIDAGATTEMAMAQIALGDFAAAEDFAGQSITMNDKDARAYLALGTALDAQTRHQDAEVAFRQGLKYWKGDPTPILNNLALNLASQGHLQESLSLLERAMEISPNRMDLERNRRIIATLVETSGPRAPSPASKPSHELAVDPIVIPDAAAQSATPPAKPKPLPVKEVIVREPVAPVTEQQEVMIESSTQPLVGATPPTTTLKNIGLKPRRSYN